MHTLRAPTLQRLILSCRNFTRWSVKWLSPKRCAEFSYFFCQSIFINNFMEKNNFSESQNHQKLNISRPISFKTISAHRFEDHIYINKLDGVFFLKNTFSKSWSFLHDRKTTNSGVIFFHKKLILYFFSNVII